MSDIYFYEPFYNFDRAFDRFFDRFLDTPRAGNQSLTRNENGSTIQSIKPKMDLHEDPENNNVTATFELPGLKKEDIQIDVHGGHLTISGESKISSEHKDEEYAVRERKYGRFSRILQLPQGIKDEDIKASLEEGVLTVIFPKSTPEAEPRKITVS